MPISREIFAHFAFGKWKPALRVYKIKLWASFKRSYNITR